MEDIKTQPSKATRIPFQADTLEIDFKQGSSKVIIKTPYVTIRPIVEADMGELCELFANPEVMKYYARGLPWLPERTTGIVTELWLSKFQQQPVNFYSGYTVRAKNGDFIGVFSMGTAREGEGSKKIVEIGFIYKEQFWGKGLGTHVLENMLCFIEKLEQIDGDQSFDSKSSVSTASAEMTKVVVKATARPENIASQKVLAKVGLKAKLADTGLPKEITTNFGKRYQYEATLEELLKKLKSPLQASAVSPSVSENLAGFYYHSRTKAPKFFHPFPTDSLAPASEIGAELDAPKIS